MGSLRHGQFVGVERNDLVGQDAQDPAADQRAFSQATVADPVAAPAEQLFAVGAHIVL